ncbi:MAG: class C beta-lactamase-related serine hydrolase [Chitinophagaceae bacterium]|nr:MAG: class C beta-lactamase-related serine hydrolase [Chitinophagaceae bacterium]
MRNSGLWLILCVIAIQFACSKNTESPQPAGESYYYPPLTGTTWETESPESLGWDPGKLNDLLNYVQANNSSSFIILHKGRIVVEKYWIGNAVTSAKIFSATKSMGAFMIGLAQEQGKLDINQEVNTYISPGWSRASASQEAKITVKDLISMTSGLNENLTYDTVPGARWRYNTLAYHRIYEVLASAYNQSNDNYTKAQLWDKIGMQDAFWDTEPGGGPTMSCSARDMARFGLMMLSGGKWNGAPVMTNAAYFQSMINSSQTLNPAYGYLWWLNGKSSFILPTSESFNGPLMPNAPADLVTALGYGDKKIYVVKSMDLVVIRHGSPSNAPVTYALSNFDNEIWKLLMLAIP